MQRGVRVGIRLDQLQCQVIRCVTIIEHIVCFAFSV